MIVSPALIDFFCSLLTSSYCLLESLRSLSLSVRCAFSVHSVPVRFLPTSIPRIFASVLWISLCWIILILMLPWLYIQKRLFFCPCLVIQKKKKNRILLPPPCLRFSMFQEAAVRELKSSSLIMTPSSPLISPNGRENKRTNVRGRRRGRGNTGVGISTMGTSREENTLSFLHFILNGQRPKPFLFVGSRWVTVWLAEKVPNSLALQGCWSAELTRCDQAALE